MCGILGIVNLNSGQAIDRGLINRMSSAMTHRGPDDQGSYVSESAAIAMRRLSIIDVSGGHQPISNEAEDVWVVCNGEIYNHLELRKDLMARGHVFRCNSDTEVLVHLYEEFGDKFVERLRGMFGFAILDNRRRRFLAGRDRLGIKPLYYHERAGRLLLASEIKAILADSLVPRQVDPVALREYLSWGYVPAPRTLFDSIYKVLPGHLLIVENGKVLSHRYWELPVSQTLQRSQDEWQEGIRSRLAETVRSHLLSDVPLGAFLSGGIDSSAVVGLMAGVIDRPVKTFSIGFAEEVYNELPYAKIVAKAFQTEHHEIVVRPNAFDLLPKLIWHLDEPIADSAFITTFLVSEFARQSVTVILSGVGGDELFGGYRRYLGSEIARHYNKLPQLLRDRLIPAILKQLPVDRNSKVRNYFRLAKAFVSSSHLSSEASYLRYLSVFGEESQLRLLSKEISRQADRLTTPSPLEQYLARCPTTDTKDLMMYLDMNTQLPDDLLALTDKMSMAASLECRVPLLDHEFVEFTCGIPSDLKINGLDMKYIFKKAMQPILPKSILKRKKRGFGAPVGAWFRRDLRPLSLEILSEETIKRRGFFEWLAVKQTLDAHFGEREDHTDHLLALISFELWCRSYLDGTGTAASLTRSA